MTEKLLTNAIIQYLNYSGKCWVWRVNSGMASAEYKGRKRLIRMAAAGSSDIQGITASGRFVAIEVKKPETRKSVTKKQNDFLNEISRMGGIAGVATTPEEALDILEGKENWINPYQNEYSVAQEVA